MARDKRDRFDVVSGLQDLREIITVTRPSMVREASGVATLTGMRIRPSLEAPLIHPVALAPSSERKEKWDMAVGVIAIGVGVLALGGIIALAALGVGDRPAPDLENVRALAPPVAAVGDPDPGDAPVIAYGAVAPAYEEGPVGEEGAAAKKPDRSLSKVGVDDGKTTRRKARRDARKKRRHRRDRSVGSEPVTPAVPATATKRNLTRVDVKRGLMGVTPRVKRCEKEHGGVVVVELVIGPDGKVKRATPVGQMAASTTGKCVAKAARRARFAKFSGTPLTIKYPFIL